MFQGGLNMEIASAKWLSELEMEDPTFFPQYPTMNPIDFSFDDFNFESFSPESYTSYTNIDHSHGLHIEASHNVGGDDFRRPMKQLKTTSSTWKSSCITDNIPPKAASSSSSHIISFDNSNSSPPDISQQYCGLDRDLKRKNEVGSDGNYKGTFPSLISQVAYEDQYCSPKFEQVSKRVGSSTRAPLYAQDHVIAERKRREKLSQRFISLSALIPGLKKNDKASVLGDAIKYLKQLQERVGTLENQVATKTMESVIIVRKTQIYSDDETSSCGENFESQSNNPFPEIEARVSEKDVLIRIHGEKNKGCIPNIINEVEKLHLCVLNTNVLPFGQATLDITIVAQMEADFSMTVKDLVKSLRLALLNFM